MTRPDLMRVTKAVARELCRIMWPEDAAERAPQIVQVLTMQAANPQPDDPSPWDVVRSICAGRHPQRGHWYVLRQCTTGEVERAYCAALLAYYGVPAGVLGRSTSAQLTDYARPYGVRS